MFLSDLSWWLVEKTDIETVTVGYEDKQLEVPVKRLWWLFDKVVEDEFPILIRNERQQELLDPLFSSDDPVDGYLDMLSTCSDSYPATTEAVVDLYEALLNTMWQYITDLVGV